MTEIKKKDVETKETSVESKKEAVPKEAKEPKKEKEQKVKPQPKKEEKVYTIPLKDAIYVPRKKRLKKALVTMKAYFKQHLKSEDVKISAKLNDALWARGIEKPPKRIKVKVTEEEGLFTADLVE